MERSKTADYTVTVTKGNGNLYLLADLLKRLENEDKVPNYRSE